MKFFDENVINNTSQIWECPRGIQIFPMAMVLKGAILGDYVRVQSFSIVEGGAKILAHTTIHPHNIINSEARIGRHCFISSFVGFIDRVDDVTEDKRPTYIGDGVFVGVNSTIFPVQIGDGATIGAGSIILEDVPPNTKVHGTWKGIDRA